jgi:hypothetical protein
MIKDILKVRYNDLRGLYRNSRTKSPRNHVAK